MTIWALSDPHLAFGVPNKSMEVFGPNWERYAEKIQHSWMNQVKPDDLVLIPGDISWATKLEDALVDLNWLDQLPGTKLLLKGNHDYWWPSSAKLQAVLPKSIHFIYNNVFNWHEVTIGGTRLWDTEEYAFDAFIEIQENPRGKLKSREEIEKQKEEDARIFERELERLKLSLKQLNPKAKIRIALTHYPPVDAELHPSRTSKILEEHHIDICVFGHLHNVRKETLNFGKARGIKYVFASADYLNFAPTLILPKNMIESSPV